MAVAYVYVPGMADDAGSGTAVDLWEGDTSLYLYPSEPVTLSAVSDSAEDAPGGDGAELLKLSGLDDNWLLADLFLTLDGVTIAPTTISGASLRRLFRAVAIDSTGTELSNEGTIDISGGGVLLARILADAGRSWHGTFTVPEGQPPAFLTSWRAGADKGTGPIGASFRVAKRTNTFDGVSGPWQTLDVDFSNSHGAKAGSGFLGTGVPLEARDDIRIEVLTTSSSNASIAGRLDFRFGNEGV